MAMVIVLVMALALVMLMLITSKDAPNLFRKIKNE